MRPIERIDRIIILVKKLVRKYPEKDFGTLMEEAFLLLQNEYIKLYFQGNRERSKYLFALFNGEDSDSYVEGEGDENAQMKNIKSIMKNVIKYSDNKNEEEGRVHPMLVEDDIIEVIFNIMIEN